MNVLLCSPTETVGGITKWTNYIVDFFNKNPQSEISLMLFPMNNTKYLGDNASKIKRIRYGVPAYLKVISKFRKTVDVECPDVAHISSSASLGLIRDYLMLRICRKKKIKSCLHLHFGRIPEVMEKDNWEWKLLKKAIALSSKVIVMNNACETALKNYGFKNIENIPNPLSPDVISLAEKCDKQRQNRKLVYVGHILTTKGIDELIASLQDLNGFTLHLVGEDTMGLETQLRNRYPDSFANNEIIFAGQKSHEYVIEEMKSGIFVFPSYTEGFPNVILESMACGVPIIATNVGSIPEMLTPEDGNPCGIVIPSKNVDGIKTAILYLSENKNIADKMGTAAKKRVNDLYNITTVCYLLTNCWKSTFK